MKNLITSIIFSFILLFSIPALASQLLMINHPGCSFCRAFLKEVEPTYSESKQGKALPLHIVDVSVSKNREWARTQIRTRHIKPFRGTPTFIILDQNGVEKGRVVGYGGKDWFYKALDEAVKRSVQQ